jgi:hypothetical protein
MAIATSEAVPAGVDDDRDLHHPRMRRMLCGLRMPASEPMGAASGITAAQPASSSFRAVMGREV